MSLYKGISQNQPIRIQTQEVVIDKKHYAIGKNDPTTNSRKIYDLNAIKRGRLEQIGILKKNKFGQYIFRLNVNPELSNKPNYFYDLPDDIKYKIQDIASAKESEEKEEKIQKIISFIQNISSFEVTNKIIIKILDEILNREKSHSNNKLSLIINYNQLEIKYQQLIKKYILSNQNIDPLRIIDPTKIIKILIKLFVETPSRKVGKPTLNVPLPPRHNQSQLLNLLSPNLLEKLYLTFVPFSSSASKSRSIPKRASSASKGKSIPKGANTVGGRNKNVHYLKFRRNTNKNKNKKYKTKKYKTKI